MTALDYFLYDNRTWSAQWGRDWGLKAATGVLAARSDLKAAFDRYCGAMPGGQGQLGGFGEALGGVRPKTGDGYLLCVTLESSDSFGRPSWAVYGLWCPNRAVLEQVLSAGDPTGSARAFLGSETPPSAVEIRAAKNSASPNKGRRSSAGPVFRRFATGPSVREVTSLLLASAQGRSALPNVLGITATSRLGAVAQEGFEVVYCHPMEERTERALSRRLGGPEPEEREEDVPPEEILESGSAKRYRPVESPPPTPPTQPAPRSTLGQYWPLWLTIAIAGAGWVLVDYVRREPSGVHREPPPSANLERPRAGQKPAPEEQSAEAVLRAIGERLEECKKLSPEELRRSRGFIFAETLEVLPPFQDRRARVQRAYSALIEIQERMVKRQLRNYVAYFYDDAGKDATKPPDRLQKIAEILGEAPLGGADCTLLEEAFGFEAENRGSALRQWCDTLRRLEETAELLTPATVKGVASPRSGAGGDGRPAGSSRPASGQ